MWARWNSTSPAPSIAAQTVRNLDEATEVMETVKLSLESVLPDNRHKHSHHHPVVSAGSDLRQFLSTTQSTLQQAQEKWKALFASGTPPTDLNNNFTASLSPANSRTNNSWGDDLQAKGDGITRIYVTNLNGLQLDKRGGKFDTVCRSLKEVQADVFCGQEHNVDTTKSSLRTILFDTANQHWERQRVLFGTSPIQFKKRRSNQAVQ
jgi:hypothetical protein